MFLNILSLHKIKITFEVALNFKSYLINIDITQRIIHYSLNTSKIFQLI